MNVSLKHRVQSARTSPIGSETEGISSVVAILQQLCSRIDELHAKVDGNNKSHLTVEEVAQMTGRAPYTVRAWIKAGRICAERVLGSGPKGRLLIPRVELAKLIVDGKGSSVPAAAILGE